MKKTKPGRVILVVLVSILLLFVMCEGCHLLNQLPGDGPISGCEPEMEALLIDLEVFPTGWEKAGGVKQDYSFTRLATESCQQSFRTGGGPDYADARHRIYQYRNTLEAVIEFREMADYSTSTTAGRGPWISPDNPALISELADQFVIGCTEIYMYSQERCKFHARYGSYIVEFGSYMSGTMTEDDLVHIIQAIDDKMVEQGIVETE